jgi:hypothetical protein
MDLSDARSEPFVQFLEFHDRFNRQFKATVTALEYLRATVTEGSAQRQAFLEHMDRRWRDGHNWTTAGDVLRHGGEDACRLAIAHIHSALDDFADLVLAEHSPWCGVSNLPRPSKGPPPGGEHEPLWKLCYRLDLSHVDLVTWRPLLAAFRVMRDCIVHRASRASSRLVELAQSSALTELLKSWPIRRGAQPPPFPSFRANATITIAPKTVILCLDAARRSAGAINRSMIDFLGPAGFSYAAARHVLLDEDLEILSKSYRTPNRAIGHVLDSRYGATSLANEPEVLLRRLGYWEKCKRAHSTLYAAAVAAGRFKVPHGFKLP